MAASGPPPTLVLGCAGPVGESGTDGGAVDSASVVNAGAVDAAEDGAPADGSTRDAASDAATEVGRKPEPLVRFAGVHLL